MNMNDMQGTDFQKLVWNEVLTIPFGEVRSYKQIAQAIDRPLSYRCLLYTSPSPRDLVISRMPSSA